MIFQEILDHRKHVQWYISECGVSKQYAQLCLDIRSLWLSGEITAREFHERGKALGALFPQETQKVLAKKNIRINGVEIKGGCSIVAMRNLLEDPEWGPQGFVQLVIDRRHDIEDLEIYAPVCVHRRDIRSKVKVIDSHTKIAICYRYGERSVHIECILQKDFYRYENDDVVALITRRGQE